MAKIVAEKTIEAAGGQVKQVEIKHTKVMKNASGNNVTVVDWSEVKPLDEAIEQAENNKTQLEAQLAEVETELTDLKALED